MKVELIDYTRDALEKLLFTKQTRLSMNGGLLDEIKAWPQEKKMQELAYMRGTIQSSWEFASYTFSIQEVSRAFTHQLVRTRAGHYAQQSQRTVNMEGFGYVVPDVIEADTVEGDLGASYAATMDLINIGYNDLIGKGVSPQDARGVLPTNIETNIIAEFSLRTLADMAKVRLCYRTQGEYQSVFREMRKRVIEVHPWTEDFIRVNCAATGVCCFPNFKDCPIKPPTFNPDTGKRWDEKENQLTGQPLRPATKTEIQEAWEETKYEAIPTEMKRRQPNE